MVRRTRLVLAALFAVGLLVAPQQSASAQEGGPKNTAVAINTKDGTTEVDAAFQVRRLDADTVDPQNAAFAFSSCASSCNAMAVAMQVAFVYGQPHEVTPVNEAIAFNYQCDTCISVADAYQWVVGVPDGADLTPDGKDRLKEVRKDLHGLEKTELSPLELQPEVDALNEEVKDVLATEIQHDPKGDRENEEQKLEDEPTTPGAPTPEAVATVAPAPTGDDSAALDS